MLIIKVNIIYIMGQVGVAGRGGLRLLERLTGVAFCRRFVCSCNGWLNLVQAILKDPLKMLPMNALKALNAHRSSRKGVLLPTDGKTPLNGLKPFWEPVSWFALVEPKQLYS